MKLENEEIRLPQLPEGATGYVINCRKIYNSERIEAETKVDSINYVDADGTVQPFGIPMKPMEITANFQFRMNYKTLAMMHNSNPAVTGTTTIHFFKTNLPPDIQAQLDAGYQIYTWQGIAIIEAKPGEMADGEIKVETRPHAI